MKLSKIEAKTRNELIAKVIAQEMKDHHVTEVYAGPIAFAEAKRRGMDIAMSASYVEPVQMMISKVTETDTEIIAKITIAAEMVQDYHITEVYWMAEEMGDEVEYIPVLKDWSELKKMIKDLDDRKVKDIPYVEPHAHGIFIQEQIPTDLKDNIKDFIKPEEVKGKYVGWYVDEKSHKIKGEIHMDKKKCDPKGLEDVKNHKPLSVSIGFICDFDMQVGDLDGEKYVAIQRNLRLGHVAGILEGSGKCPIGICGINQDFKKGPKLMHIYLRTPLEIKVGETDSKEGASQPITESPHAAVINEGHDHLHNSNDVFLPTNVGHSNMTEAELLKEIERLKSENQTIKDSQTATKLKELKDSSEDATKQLGFAQAAIKTKDTELSNKDAELKTYQEKLKVIEDKEGKADREWLVEKLGSEDEAIDLGDGKPARKIKELCNHDARLGKIILSKMFDSLLKTQGLSFGTQQNYDAAHKSDSKDGNKPAIIGNAVDPD